jgi:hypothetical protein
MYVYICITKYKSLMLNVQKIVTINYETGEEHATGETAVIKSYGDPNVVLCDYDSRICLCVDCKKTDQSAHHVGRTRVCTKPSWSGRDVVRWKPTM